MLVRVSFCASPDHYKGGEGRVCVMREEDKITLVSLSQPNGHDMSKPTLFSKEIDHLTDSSTCGEHSSTFRAVRTMHRRARRTVVGIPVLCASLSPTLANYQAVECVNKHALTTGLLAALSWPVQYSLGYLQDIGSHLINPSQINWWARLPESKLEADLIVSADQHWA